VHGVDLVPTVLACMGLASSTARDGLDLTLLWRGQELPERALFAEADHTNKVDGEHLLDIKQMVRRGPQKLHFDSHARTTSLFDLARDPEERVDLAPERPEETRALLTELERFRGGAVVPESIARPTAEELELLEGLGYGGGGDEE
jgi:arylsulfatase A-like enzyme